MRYLLLAFLIGCGHGTQMAVIPPNDSNTMCCNRLDAASDALKKFERYCVAASYLGSRYADSRVQGAVKEALSICKYVFGTK